MEFDPGCPVSHRAAVLLAQRALRGSPVHTHTLSLTYTHIHPCPYSPITTAGSIDYTCIERVCSTVKYNQQLSIGDHIKHWRHLLSIKPHPARIHSNLILIPHQTSSHSLTKTFLQDSKGTDTGRHWTQKWMEGYTLYQFSVTSKVFPQVITKYSTTRKFWIKYFK